ncbi:glycosyltransferase family 2 protein [Aliiroseovarius subalbicans]|uniref:glycosyltransferase family 2 protein n=1 Tax=Aliiroseovarius subalbicans TaxID=2925840 RepID=UPI001F561E10|nr:glycosyltransferase family 2 protein [Aliiroseovarius subalbicans]MCI2398180.1 glycosyltransferase family 2 protein [Aliiroseovarius subalbicans]
MVKETLKLVIQIPCFNEAETLPATLADLPREVSGFDKVEWLVVDDGSTDGTSEVARVHGVDHIVRLDHNSGLAKAFMTGLEAALHHGADVIVNTDADNQYQAAAIPDLTSPILEGRAGVVIGSRPIEEIEHFSVFKRFLQKAGSKVVRMAAGVEVPDAPSGFRAFQREAAMHLYVFNNYTYTLETIIQAGRLGIPHAWVPVGVNAPTRPSRLVRNSADYVLKSTLTILRVFVLYRPFRFFATCALILSLPGIAVFVRFSIYWALGDGGGKVQSLTIGGAFIVSAMIILIGGVLAGMVAANRMLLAEIRYRQLRSSLGGGHSRHRVDSDP